MKLKLPAEIDFKLKNLRTLLFLLIALVFICAVPRVPRNEGDFFFTGKSGYDGHPGDTTFILNGIAVDILRPVGMTQGCILVLPGWNFSRTLVCTNSEFCELAKKSGYCLILPEMGKSVYLTKIFSETREDWKRYPTLTWVIDTMIPYLQKNFRLLEPGRNNFLFGISTGGRGVAQVAENTGRLFTAGAALSGDYNQELWKDDRLMTGFLGPFEKFPSRWTGVDNPSLHADQLKIPLFLGHGGQDKSVPVDQTLRYYERISALDPTAEHVLHIQKEGGHNWDYWNSEMHRIFAFFQEKSPVK